MDSDFDIDLLRDATAQGRIQWHQHALARFLERGISRDEAIGALMNGEVIEMYPTDRPYPSGLILYAETEPVHVVAAVAPAARICYVITAYRIVAVGVTPANVPEASVTEAIATDWAAQPCPLRQWPIDRA